MMSTWNFHFKTQYASIAGGSFGLQALLEGLLEHLVGPCVNQDAGLRQNFDLI